MYVLYRCRKNPCLLARVALVSKEEQDQAKKRSAEDHLPLRDLEDNLRGLPCEAEIALANVNKRKGAEEKRQVKKCTSKLTTTRDKENAEPPLKAKKKSRCQGI